MEGSTTVTAREKWSRPRVVIVGGGFGGLRAARRLREAPVDVVLVDRQNHHLFQPLLYQVATAGLGAPEIASPLRKLLRSQTNATVFLADIVGIDGRRRRLRTADGATIDYDYLILAAGLTHHYFGHDDWAPHAPGLKTLAEALEIRRRLLLAFEAAEREENTARRQALLTFVIVGAGPTGVELAGAVAEMARHTLAPEFRRCDPKSTRVVLVDRAERALPAFAAKLSARAEAQLRTLGVEVRTCAHVLAIDGSGVLVDAEHIASATVLWAAGVAASPLTRELAAARDGAGRLLVDEDLRVPGEARVFAIGDLAAIRDARGKWVPGVAPAAVQEGEHAAENVLRLLRGEPTLSFHYQDKGMLATVGRSRAVADIFGLRFSGFIAWLTWLFVHILYLVGFRNRASVLFDWTWAYFTYQRSARIIASREPLRLPAMPPETAETASVPSGEGSERGEDGENGPRRAGR